MQGSQALGDLRVVGRTVPPSCSPAPPWWPGTEALFLPPFFSFPPAALQPEELTLLLIQLRRHQAKMAGVRSDTLAHLRHRHHHQHNGLSSLQVWPSDFHTSPPPPLASPSNQPHDVPKPVNVLFNSLALPNLLSGPDASFSSFPNDVLFFFLF